MAADKVESDKDFKWESQLRYYWEHHEAPPSGVPAQVRLPPHLSPPKPFPTPSLLPTLDFSSTVVSAVLILPAPARHLFAGYICSCLMHTLCSIQCYPLL